MARRAKPKPYVVSYEAPSGGRTGGFTLGRHAKADAAATAARKLSKRTRITVCAFGPGDVEVACYRGGRRV